jgi:hypothetical protein
LPIEEIEWQTNVAFDDLAFSLVSNPNIFAFCRDLFGKSLADLTESGRNCLL